MPKINHLKTDILERGVDLAFLQEVWEQVDNTDHMNEIEIFYTNEICNIVRQY